LSVTIESLFEAAKAELDKIDETAKISKTEIFKNLAEELEGKIREDSIAEEIAYQLADKVSKTLVYKTLDKKYKNKKKSQAKQKKNQNADPQWNRNVSSSGQETVQEPNPNPIPEPVYNQGQTVVPEPITEEQKAPDQGYIGKDYDDSNIQYYDAEKDELKKTIETLQNELAEARTTIFELQNKPQTQKSPFPFHFSLQDMINILEKYKQKGAVNGLIIVKDGKVMIRPKS